MVPAARKFPDRSKSTGFCLGCQQVVWCRHPGRARPGLIEARCSIRIRGSAVLHPGRARPGLIEAISVSAWTGSEAAHPGRARPGLIEASHAEVHG